MKEEWLMPGAIVPVNTDTTKALVAEIKRLIDVVGSMVLKQGPDYERGFIDGMQKQMQSSVDKAVNAMSRQDEKQEPVAWLCERDGQGYSFAYTAEQLHQLGYGNISVPPFRKVAPLYTTPQPQREWVGLTLEDKKEYLAQDFGGSRADAMDWAEQRLKEKNA